MKTESGNKALLFRAGFACQSDQWIASLPGSLSHDDSPLHCASSPWRRISISAGIVTQIMGRNLRVVFVKQYTAFGRSHSAMCLCVQTWTLRSIPLPALDPDRISHNDQHIVLIIVSVPSRTRSIQKKPSQGIIDAYARFLVVSIVSAVPQ